MDTAETDAKRRILSAAIEVIDAEGDAALRITDIASRAGVATGLINHHFGSRDGLVAAAQAERYRGLAGRDIESFRALGRAGVPPEEIDAAIREMCEMLAGRERSEFRMRRVSAIGATHGRPELRNDLARISTETIDEFARVLEVGQSYGLVRTDVRPRVLATLVLSTNLGLVLADLDVDPVPQPELADLAYHLITGS